MKIALIIIAVIVVLAGGACAAGGGIVAGLAGQDGWIDSGTGDLTSDTRALVSDTADVTDEEGGDVIDRFDIRIRGRAEAEDDVFIGVGRSADVERYLNGAEYEVITEVDFDPLEVEDSEEIPGNRTLDPPGEQGFWVASGSGSGRQEFNWEVSEGNYRFVFMNADASPGVDVRASMAVKIPHLFWIGIGVAIAGAVFFVIGVIVIVLVARSFGRSSPPARRDEAPPPPPRDDVPPRDEPRAEPTEPAGGSP
jgi:hypothetical protein